MHVRTMFSKLALPCLFYVLCSLVFVAHARDLTFSDGARAYTKKDFQEARRIWTQLAEKNDALSAYNLGVLYQNGVGTAINYELAFNFYSIAASRGKVEAIHNIGYLYQHGKGVMQDNSAAVAWYMKAANLGFVTSQYDLADMYLNGRGTPRDFGKAMFWYEKAANQGAPDAIYNIGQFYLRGLGVQQNRTIGCAYIKASIQHGYTLADQAVTWCNTNLNLKEVEEENTFLKTIK